MCYRPVKKCACMSDLGSHGRPKFLVCVGCSVLTSGIFITRGQVSGLIFLIGYHGRIKFPVAPAYKWLV